MTHQRRGFRDKYLAPLLITMLLLFSAASQAQVYQLMPNRYEIRESINDSSQGIPYGATPSLRGALQTTRPGRLFYRTTDSTLVMWTGSQWIAVGGGTDINWGDIGGTIADQTDLMALFNTKQPLLPSGSVSQYWAANSTLHNFDSSVKATGDPRYAPIVHTHSTTDILNFTNQVRNSLSAGSGIDYNPSTGVFSIPGTGFIGSLNGLTAGIQTFATGTSGTDFNISSAGTQHTFNLPSASASNRGLLTASDWSMFNSKVSTPQLADSTSLIRDALTIGLATKEDLANKSTSNLLGSSDVLYPSQKAVKEYVDNAVASAGGYTDEQAQDAVGAMADPTEFTYDDATNSLVIGLIEQSKINGLVAELAAKQATLVSGTNIKTVNGNSLLGSGDVSVGDAYLANAQTFTAVNTFDEGLVINNTTKFGLSAVADAGTSVVNYLAITGIGQQTLGFRTPTELRSDIAAAPATGSTNYIQNTTSQQTSANFNIDGTGTLAGLLTVKATDGSAFNPSITSPGSLRISGADSNSRLWLFGGTPSGKSTNAGAAYIRLDGSNLGGVFEFGYGSSGSIAFYAVTPGSPTTYNPVLFGTGSGRVLIGTTSDDGSNKLQVNGTGKFGGPLTLKETSEPSTPSAGDQVIWPDLSGSWKVKNSAGTVSTLGSGSGAAGSITVLAAAASPGTTTGTGAYETIYTYTLPAGTCSANGDVIRIEVQFSTTGTDTKQVDVTINGGTITGSATATTAGEYLHKITLMRNAATTAIKRAETWRTLTFNGISQSTSTSVIWGSNQDIVIKASSTNSGSVVIQSVRVILEKAP